MWSWPDLDRLSEGVPLPPVRGNFIDGVPDDEPWALPTYPTAQEILESLMALRDPQYRQIADIIVETDGRRVAAVIREIRRRLADLPP